MPEIHEADNLYVKYREGEPVSKTAISLVDDWLFDILDPSTWVFDLDTIATSVANLCRFNGHVRNFYSVAEHEVRVSETLEQWGESPLIQYLGLHHDDVEFVLGDQPSPQKRLMAIDGEPFKDFEESIEYVYYQTIGLLDTFIESWDVVKSADLAVYLQERDERPYPGKGQLPDVAKTAYIMRHVALQEQLGESVPSF